MNDQLITFYTAKLAKEKGFCTDTYTGFTYDETGEISNLAFWVMDNDVRCAAPTQTKLQRWLREVHNILVYVECNFTVSQTQTFGYILKSNGNNVKLYTHTHNISKYSYEEALEIGLQEALKLIEI